ncbi:MAG: hypothetical protein FJ197_11725 [Gammaproteobacteria bacterium]|nr:hypothetical protein [Gammaproteobacteria bacterium]
MTNRMPADADPLAQALAWLLAGDGITRQRLEEASSRFGLTPLQSAVLFRYGSATCPELYEPGAQDPGETS